MTHYQAYLDFSPQVRSIGALMAMHARVARDDTVSIVELLPIVVFTAFSIEAYINSIGARKIMFWDQLERLPWRHKMEILHTNAERSAEWSRGPLQFAADVFRIRDQLAHGRSERVRSPLCDTVENAHSFFSTRRDELEPNWYKGITREWVIASQERFRLLMVYLGDLYGFPETDHLHAASGDIDAVPDPL